VKSGKIAPQGLRVINSTVSSQIARLVKVDTIEVFIVDVKGESVSEPQGKHCGKVFQSTALGHQLFFSSGYLFMADAGMVIKKNRTNVFLNFFQFLLTRHSPKRPVISAIMTLNIVLAV
jgi:hypothetical protein